MLFASGMLPVDVVHLLGEERGLVDRRVGGGLDDREDDALILGRRQLALRHQVEGHRQHRHDRPEHQHDRPVLQRAGQDARVAAADAVEAPVDPAGEAALAVARAQQPSGHHRRQREGDDAGHDDRAGQREGELAEQRAGEAALDADRGVDRGQRDRHGDDRPDQLARRRQRRRDRRHAGVQVALDVLDHHDRVVDDEPDRQHDGQQRQQVDGEAGGQHQEDGADQRDRDGDHRDDDGAERAEEQEDDQDDDQQRLGQRPQHLVDGVLDVGGRVVGHADLHAGRQLGLDGRHLGPHALDHFERVRRRQHPDAHEHRGLAVEADVLLVVLGAEHDVGDLAEADDDAVLLLHDQLAELLGRPQVGVGHQVDRDHRSLGAADRRQVVVAGQRLAQLRRRDAPGRHLLGLQPDPHRERPRAEDVGALDAGDGAQLRLHDAGQVVGDLVLIETRRREAEIQRGELVVRHLQLDPRRLGLGRQVVADLGHLGLDLRQRRVGVVVQVQVDEDGAQRLRAGRLDEVDAVGAGDDALERRRDEAADQVGVGADVGRRDAHHRDVAARILADAEGADRLQPGDQDHQVDDDG